MCQKRSVVIRFAASYSLGAQKLVIDCASAKLPVAPKCSNFETV